MFLRLEMHGASPSIPLHVLTYDSNLCVTNTNTCTVWLFVKCVMLPTNYILCDLQFGCSRQILREAQEIRKLCETESLTVVS
jgi:hypothetical protein